MATFINQWSLLQAFVAKLAKSSNLKTVKEKNVDIQSDRTCMLCLVCNIFFLEAIQNWMCSFKLQIILLKCGNMKSMV
jgi:hypothetical protein